MKPIAYYFEQFNRLLLLALTLLALVGCGFHLRGMVDVPRWLNNVGIISPEGHRDLEPRLKEQLRSYNINVIAEPDLARYWLIIESDHFQQNISSISSSTTPRQYQLEYAVRFKLQRAKGGDVVSSNQIIISRHITINSDRILGSNDEESLQKNEMIRDAATQVLYRLSRNSEDLTQHPSKHH